MSIKREHAPAFGQNVEYVHETRHLKISNLSVGNSRYNVVILWRQHQTFIEGVLESKMKPTLDMIIIGVDNNNRYQGVIVDMGLGSSIYDTYSFRKLNSERSRVIAFDLVKPIVDAVWEYYQSPAGQRAIIEQTIWSADEEINEVKSRLAELEEWRTSLTNLL